MPFYSAVFPLHLKIAPAMDIYSMYQNAHGDSSGTGTVTSCCHQEMGAVATRKLGYLSCGSHSLKFQIVFCVVLNSTIIMVW